MEVAKFAYNWLNHFYIQSIFGTFPGEPGKFYYDHLTTNLRNQFTDTPISTVDFVAVTAQRFSIQEPEKHSSYSSFGILVQLCMNLYILKLSYE